MNGPNFQKYLAQVCSLISRKIIGIFPYNFPRNGAIDWNRVFLESPDHSPFPMGLSEVSYRLPGGRWGPSKSIQYFLISNLFPCNFARNGATDLNQVFLENSDHSVFLIQLSEVPHYLNGGRWGCQIRYRIFSFLTVHGKIPINTWEMGLQTRIRYFLESSDHS